MVQCKDGLKTRARDSVTRREIVSHYTTDTDQKHSSVWLTLRGRHSHFSELNNMACALESQGMAYHVGECKSNLLSYGLHCLRSIPYMIK